MTDEEPRQPYSLWYRPPEDEDWDLSPRRASASEVTLSEIIDITGSNLLGNVHGGTLMKLVDNAGGVAAIKHCGGPVVTVAMDEMTFMEPVFVGEVVTVKAMVNDTGHTSMEVGVRVEAENARTGRRVHTSSAYLVYVALDREGKPRPVPPVIPENEEQAQRQREAKLRRDARLARKKAILEARAARGED
jgi:acyl-CoA hydrolase